MWSTSPVDCFPLCRAFACSSLLLLSPYVSVISTYHDQAGVPNPPRGRSSFLHVTDAVEFQCRDTDDCMRPPPTLHGYCRKSATLAHTYSSAVQQKLTAKLS